MRNRLFALVIAELSISLHLSRYREILRQTASAGNHDINFPGILRCFMENPVGRYKSPINPDKMVVPRELLPSPRETRSETSNRESSDRSGCVFLLFYGRKVKRPRFFHARARVSLTFRARTIVG